MKILGKNSFWKKYIKLSIWVMIITEFLLTITILPQSLPTWEVNNPVSKVFVMDEIPPTAGSLAAGNSTVPDEYLVDPAIDTLLLLMETQGTYLHRTSSRPFGIVGSDDIVIIKASFQWDFRNTTSTDRIKGVIWQILNHPDGFTGEILVGDNTQWASTGEDDNNSEDTNQSILDVINTFHSKGFPVYLFEWKNIMNNVVTEYSDGDYNDGYPYDPVSKITYPKFQSPSGNHYISLKYGIWNATTQTYNHDRLCIIDFPVLKAHGWTGATLAIKNWIGVLTVAYQNERYGGDGPMHFDYMFSEYALPAKVMQVTFPKLTIIDGAWANPERNYGSDAVQLNMLLGSTDPFAASWYAAKYMLTPVAYYPERTNPDNVGGEYNQCLNNWVNCMHDSGFAVTIDASEISVYNRDVFSGISTFYLTASILNGWNMVSVPGINPDGMAVSTWWSGRNPLADVYKWNGTYTGVTSATPTEGYWMLHTGANTYNTGDEWPAGGIQIVAHNPIAIFTGWNMIGGYDNSSLVSGLTTTPGNLIVAGTVYGWNGTYFNPTNLVPGYGYWLLSTGDGVINPPTLANGSSELVVQDNKEDWGKITLTDATGKNYVLYAVNGEVNLPTGQAGLESYQLPPLPPTGTFDVRYSSGKKAEKFDEEMQTIEMRGITYPVKVRVENVGIRLQDETGKIVNQRLKSGEEITISSSSVNKLNVFADLLPVEYALEQNYPNPFNPSTTIKFAIPKEELVSLSVFNILGEKVKELKNEMMKPGYYELEFDASDLASGIYLYRINAGDFVEIKKLVLVK